MFYFFFFILYVFSINFYRNGWTILYPVRRKHPESLDDGRSLQSVHAIIRNAIDAYIQNYKAYRHRRRSWRDDVAIAPQ